MYCFYLNKRLFISFVSSLRTMLNENDQNKENIAKTKKKQFQNEHNLNDNKFNNLFYELFRSINCVQCT